MSVCFSEFVLLIKTHVHNAGITCNRRVVCILRSHGKDKLNLLLDKKSEQSNNMVASEVSRSGDRVQLAFKRSKVSR